MGDFNARVGSRVRSNEEDQWERVCGPHGVGEVNEAGEELLNFLLQNESTICNTWFYKKSIHKYNWQHSRSKVWHCIDFAIVRQKNRRQCLDAEVKRGAECHTDHQLLRIKMKMSGQWLDLRKRKKIRRYDVACLRERKDDSREDLETRKCFQEAIWTRISSPPNRNETMTEKWERLESALTESAKSELQYEHRKQPDWFQESLETLEPLLCRRNQLYARWLGTRQACDHRRFSEARAAARKAVRAAKNS